jgi:NAD(P)-dependent dehydrogenase (short-subunit alcohol dehydrogenase family)
MSRIVLVTNVCHFVGLPAAGELARQGATVVCHDASFAEAAARQQFESENPELSASPESDPRALIGAVVGAHDRLDALICNDAFPAIRAAVEEADLDDLRAGLESMLVAPFAMSAAAVPQMKAQAGGKIIFVTSAVPFHGLPNYSMYVAARGGANALALSLAKELARHNIQVNAIAPNYVESPSYFPPDLLANAESLAKITRNIPLGRLGKPAEAAAAIAFLALGESDFITGHVMPLAGGWA